MINKLIALCLRQRWLVLIAFTFIIIFGWRAMRSTPVDAIPDIGEMQVLVYADWPGRSPQDVENQIIYPLTTGLMGTPGVKVVRSSSGFGFGLVNMIFKEGTDFYWARSRVLERMDLAKKELPTDVTVTLGPDATGLGQVFWYTVEGEGFSLDELRSVQDWYVRYALTSVDGVSEVASVGGHVKQYQILVDPNKLFSYNISILDINKAVKDSNIDVGAKVFEEGGMEYVVRGIGFIQSIKDIEDIVLGMFNDRPLYVKDVAQVTLGPDFRRGVLDKEGKEAVGGVVLMRYGANPLKVIERVKDKLKEIQPGLPQGVEIVPFYDRTELIHRAIDTLKDALVQQVMITLFVITIFLLHFWGSMIVSMVLPIGILITFILMKVFGVDANIMSLGGIAIAIGVMVDAGCVLVEHIYTKIAEAQQDSDKPLNVKQRLKICTSASQDVGRPVLFAMLTTIVSFLPVFVLTGQAGKLFRPLAFTKTFAMTGAAVIALLLLPTLCYFFLRGRLKTIEENRTAKVLRRSYFPILNWALVHKKIVAIIAVGVLGLGLSSGMMMKQEFMPPLNESDLLFMPVLFPGASLTQVQEVMQKQDVIIKQIPEVERVVGKLGRAETPTDPAPVLMIETIINLKDKKEWRSGMTRDKLIQEIQQKTKMPGVSPIMTQPIRNRIDMLATGIQTPVGIKVFGPDLTVSEKIAVDIEKIIAEVPGAIAPYAERIGGRPYFEMDINRQVAARYGIRVQDIQDVIMSGIGGMNVSTVLEGRERYPVQVRYERELRDNPEALKRVLVPTRWMGRNAPEVKQIPLAQLVEFKKVPGPSMILSENTMNYVRVFINVDQSKQGLIDFVNKAQQHVQEAIEGGRLSLPQGYYLGWSGQFQSEMESRQRLLPSMLMALAVIALLLYMAFNNFSILGILATGLPIALMGGLILMWPLGFRLSTAVWVGFIALFGIATDNAVVLLSRMEEAFKNKTHKSIDGIRHDVAEACLSRVRPVIMTTATTIIALMPVMLSTGTGSEVMKPMAAPTVGGLITATLSNLILVPVLYSWLKERQLKQQEKQVKIQEV